MATKFASALIPGSTTFPCFPHLFNLSILKAEDIFCFLSPSSDWDFHFCRNFRDSEVVELSSLLVLLQNSRSLPPVPMLVFGLSLPLAFSPSPLFALFFLSPYLRPLSPIKLFGLLLFLLKFKSFFRKLLGVELSP